MDNESPELIEREMEQTRASLTQKVSALENQVVCTIHEATESVSNTVDSVTSTVKDTLSGVKDTLSSVKQTVSESVSEVSEKVKSVFDLSQHTRDYPWAMVGGAAALGFLTGLIAFRDREKSESVSNYSTGEREWNRLAASSAAPRQQAAAEPREPSWLDNLLDRAGQEIRTLGETFIASASTSLKQAVQEQMPKLIDTGIQLVTERTGANEPTGAGAYPYPPTARGPVC
jgi:ElaB/YqjD/DUF883 family membrane-anchored ribosome-binding protein